MWIFFALYSCSDIQCTYHCTHMTHAFIDMNWQVFLDLGMHMPFLYLLWKVINCTQSLVYGMICIVVSTYTLLVTEDS